MQSKSIEHNRSLENWHNQNLNWNYLPINIYVQIKSLKLACIFFVKLFGDTRWLIQDVIFRINKTFTWFRQTFIFGSKFLI